MNPNWTSSILGRHKRVLHRGIIELVVGRNARASRSNRQGQLERRETLGCGEMSIFNDDLQEPIVYFFVRDGVVEGAIGYAVE